MKKLVLIYMVCFVGWIFQPCENRARLLSSISVNWMRYEINTWPLLDMYCVCVLSSLLDFV